MKNICIALFVILLLQSTKAGDSIGTTTTTVTPISGSDYCSAFIYKCVASGKQDDGVASPNTASADGITFAWTLKIDGNAAPSFVENTDYWVKSDSTFSTTTATSYIILRPKLFTSVTKGANVLTCTQTQKVGSTPVTTASANTASISATNDTQLTVAKADDTCATAPVLTLTESSGCTTIEAFIKGGVAADKMYVLGTADAVAGPSTLAISTTYTVVAIKVGVVANTVTKVTLGASANCKITATDVSSKTDPCNVQVISFEYDSVASSTVDVAVSKTVPANTTPITDTTKYYVQESATTSGKTKQVVVVQSKTFAANDIANISLGFQKDNVLRLVSKSVTMTGSAQATCDSTAMTSAFSNDCQTNTLTASAATTAWTYYGLDTTFTAPGTAAEKIEITKKGIYIADLSTTTGTPVIKQEYLQVTDTDCVKITQASTQTSTDRCAAMSFTCVTNLATPTYAWTNSPSTATLSTTVNAAALTIAANIFTSTDATKQTLKCTVNTSKEATLDINLVATACSSGNGSGNGSGSGSGDDDDDSSSILSILALLLVALLL